MNRTLIKGNAYHIVSSANALQEERSFLMKFNLSLKVTLK